jgi:hypothetical protein
MTLRSDVEGARAAVDAAIASKRHRSRNGHDDESPPLIRKLDYIEAAALPDADDVLDNELIEGLVGRRTLAVIYGDSNCGKTFLAVDMCMALGRRIPWMGRPTDGGLVVYLAAESPHSVQMRLRAYQRHHRMRVPGVIVVRSPINLFDGDADVSAVIALIAQLEREHGEKVSLIVGDTLARLVVGANENSGEDMGKVIRNVDTVRAATGAAFLLVHHCGKDAARGMRGWSGLRAAADTEIEVTVDEATGLRIAEITKQRDMPGKGDRIGFRLEPVPLGANRWGTPRGSCVVVSTDAPAKAVRSKRPSEIAGAITEFLTARGTGCARGAAVKHFEGRYVRQSVYKEINKMLDAGLLVEVAGVIALPGKPGASA